MVTSIIQMVTIMLEVIMANQDQPKRFEDWTQVDCNECARYWDSSCDGSQGSQRPCNSFLATRSVVIPGQLKALEKRINHLRISCIISDISVLLFMIAYLMRWL